MGFAQSRLGRAEARQTLQRAVQADPTDAEALCYLGDTCCPSNESYVGKPGGADDCCRNACEHYAGAFEREPNEPHVLRSFLECTLCRELDRDRLRLLRPALETGVETCRRRTEIGVYVPYGHYDAGVFNLLLGRPYLSLAAFARAVHHTRGPRKIEEALSAIERLQRSAKREVDQQGEGADADYLGQWLRWSEWVSRFLMLARAVKLKQAADRLRQDAERNEPDAERARNTAEKALAELRDTLALPDAGGFSEPLVIVAGGTDDNVKQRIDEYTDLMQAGFKGFEGTIVSGGTRSGICGIVGDLELGEGANRISYLPAPDRLAPGVSRHPAYEARVPRQDAAAFNLYPPEGPVEFTALEPIQAWVDIVCSGLDPARVTLLGVNGGQIAAFEYRMALALGAAVGIVESSGRAAVDMKKEAHLWEGARLSWLPLDGMALRWYVVQPNCRADEPFSDDRLLERAARIVHDGYRKDKVGSSDPALKEWKELDEVYRESNRRQVLGAGHILATEGYRIVPVEEPGTPVTRFAPDEIDRMGEREHGRFVAERLRAGWRAGPRDKDKRTSPFLCSWEDLPDPIKKYDREAVKHWPRVMTWAGLKIVGPR
jgi:hypothetical protein